MDPRKCSEIAVRRESVGVLSSRNGKRSPSIGADLSGFGLIGLVCLVGLVGLGAPGCGQETGPRVAPRGGKVSDPFSTAGGLVEQLGDREFKL
ncbi:MAG: hypothetical protein RBU30_27385, partial [Polyangia bacterium]|nr:hypothetical protein [Polyangia bacterium]